MTTLQGEREFRRLLDSLKSRVSGSLGTKAVNAGLRIIRTAIRNEIPPSLKDAKKAIGSGFKKGRKKDVKEAKVGAGVGQKRKAIAKKAAKQQEKRGKKGSSGIGIGVANIHWFILGTGPRAHKSGKSTGTMPALLRGIVRSGFSKAQAAALAAIEAVLRGGIKK